MPRPEPRLTRKALAGLEAIHRYIKQDSPESASATIERIISEVDRLVEFSISHKVVSRSRTRGNPIHALSVPPFIVYYRIDLPEQQVVILDVRHGARRQLRRFE